MRLANAEATVEPGTSAPVAFEITNHGDKEQEFEVGLEGLDLEWAAIPSPTFWVNPGETKVERLFIKPPRSSESRADVYPFVLRVRSLDSGESEVVQSSVSVKAYSHVSIEATPKRGSVNAMNRSTPFSVTVVNLGNSDEALQLYASDVDDMLAFEFESSLLTLAPGQQRTLEVNAVATKIRALQGMVIAPVTISARSAENPAVAANSQVHVEIRPLVSPGTLIAIVALAALFVGWLLSMPKPPVIDSVVLDPESVEMGEQTRIVWQSSHANAVTVVVGSEVYEKRPPDGELIFTPTNAGELKIQVIAQSGKVNSEPEIKTLDVTKPPVVPEPKVLAFAAERTEVPIGTSVVLNYRLNDAVTYAYLEPIGQIDPKASSIQVPSPPDDIQGQGKKSMKYVLIVRNQSGAETRESISVTFVKKSLASIVTFSANPAEIDPLIGETVIKWQVTGADKIELEYGGRKDDLSSPQGEAPYAIQEETSFTLIATDAQGLTVRKSVTVKLKSEPVAHPPTVDPPDSTGSTGTTGTTR